ncbi:hypothetical protein [Helicobacter pylori]|nr:hypothetical protein [Helicobacter pylori]
MRSFKTICGSGGDQNSGVLDQSVKGFLVVGGNGFKIPPYPLKRMSLK